MSFNTIHFYIMNLVSLPHPNNFLVVEPLDYTNTYDFKIPHRHDYFEIILIKEGGGEQLIDFVKTALSSHSIYTIYPRQIHLLKREAAVGLVIQFRKDIFEFIFPIQHHFLYFTNPSITLSHFDFDHVYNLAQNILSLNNSKSLTSLSTYKSYNYLQILLIELIEFHHQQRTKPTDSFIEKFLQLVSQYIREKRKVNDYADLMNINADKLNSICKDSLGTTPLKIIHEELVLEIKRSMVLGNLSMKEIAFELNFESTSNFSSFVKNATSYSPSELQELLKRNL